MRINEGGPVEGLRYGRRTNAATPPRARLPPYRVTHAHTFFANGGFAFEELVGNAWQNANAAHPAEGDMLLLITPIIIRARKRAARNNNRSHVTPTRRATQRAMRENGKRLVGVFRQ